MSDAEVGLAAGDGLGATQDLMREVIIPSLGLTPPFEDGTHVALRSAEIVVTTDLYTVDPVEFPGGDIGRLAACGVVNDLLSSGAAADGVTVGLLLAPDLPRSLLSRLLISFREVLDAEGARVWAGDTKVVQRLPHGSRSR